jgi:hypothetical protein
MPINLPINPNAPLAKAVTSDFEKLLSDALSSFASTLGSDVAEYLWNLIWGIPQDPEAAMLSAISTQISTMQNQIQNLPQAITVYQSYQNAIQAAQQAVNDHVQLLASNSDPTTLNIAQWNTLNDFLTQDSEDKSDYYTYISNIIMNVYGVDIVDICQPNIPFNAGNTAAYMACFNSSAFWNQPPTELTAFINNNLQVFTTVISTISSVLNCAQMVLNYAQSVKSNTQQWNKVAPDIQQAITSIVGNSTLANNLKPVPGVVTTNTLGTTPIMYANLSQGLAKAFAFFAGDALSVYYLLTQGEQVFIQNKANNLYIGHGQPKGVNLVDIAKGICDYWTAVFSSTPIPHSPSPVSNTTADLYNFRDTYCGNLYYGGPDVAYAPATNFTGYAGDATYGTWQIQLVIGTPVNNQPSFAYVFNLFQNGQALMNDKGTPDIDTLDTTNSNFLWLIKSII